MNAQRGVCRRRIARRLIAASLLGPSLLATGIVTAPGATAAESHGAPARADGIGIRLMGAPDGSNANPLARLYVVDHLAPGARLRRRVEINNSTGTSVDVAVYVAAATIDRGTFAFESGDSQDELSSWTSVSRSMLPLAPRGSAVDAVTIDVPRTATAGDRYAVIWAQVSTITSADGGVRLVNRVGVRMYVSIGPGGAPVSNFTIGALAAERSASGQPLVVADVRDSGQSTLDLTGSLTLSDGPGDLTAGPLPAELGTLLAPAHSEPISVTLGKGLPRGPWRAELELASGPIQRSVVATITFPRVAGVTTARDGSSPLIPVVIAFAALLALGALGLVVSRRRMALTRRMCP